MAKPILSRVALVVALAGAANGCKDSNDFTVGVVKPLLVVHVDPANSSDNVSLEPVIRATFSDDVDPATLTDETFYLTDPAGSEVPGEIQYDAATFTASLEPDPVLAYTAVYTLHMTSGIKRLEDGAVLAAQVSSTLKTIDPPPLVVVGSSPSGLADDVGTLVRNPPGPGPNGTAELALEVTFSEPVRVDSVVYGDTLSVAPLGNPTAVVPAAVAWNADSTVLTLSVDTSVNLSLSADYVLTVGAAVESQRATVEGGQVGEDVVIPFKTLDPPPLLVLSPAPGILVDNVINDPAPVLAIGFSEPLDPGSVTDATIFVNQGTVSDLATSLSTTVTYVPGETSVTLTFNDPALAFTQVYTVTIAESVRSAIATQEGGSVGVDTIFRFKTVDPPPLQVVAVNPAHLAERVSRSPSITVTFSEAVRPSTATEANLFVNSGMVSDFGTRLPATVTLDAGLTTATITLSSSVLPRPHSETLTVSILGSPGLESQRATAEGGQLPVSVFTRFKTLPPPPLVVVGTEPSGGAVNVSHQAAIQATFDQPIEPTSVTAASFFLQRCTDSNCTAFVGGNVPGTFELPPLTPDNKAALRPNDPLEHNAHYQATLTTGITSLIANGEGGALGATYTFRFQVAPRPPLAVVATYPANGSGGFPEGESVVVTFNNLLYEASLTGDAIVNSVFGVGSGDGDVPNLFLRKQGETAKVPAVLSYSPATLSATIDPIGALDFNTTYEIVATRDIVDTVNQRMAAPFVAQFHTRLNALVKSVTPGDGAGGVPVTAQVIVDFEQRVDSTSNINSTNFFVTFQNSLGETVVVPGSIVLVDNDPVIPGEDRAVFTPSASQLGCLDGEYPLLYATGYTVHLTSRIRSADGLLNVVNGLQTSFTTGPDPMLAAVRTEGIYPFQSIDDRTLLTGSTVAEVPVNSTIYVDFNEDMQTVGINGTTDPGNIVLVDTVGGATVPLTRTATGPRQVRLELSPAGTLLAFDREYVLTVEGRDSTNLQEIRNTAGEPLEGSSVYRFRTSPANTMILSPNATQTIRENSFQAITFTRPVDVSTWNDSTWSMTEGGKRIGGLFSANPMNPYVVAFKASPSFREASTATVTITDGIRDTFGNPLPAGLSRTWATDTVSSGSLPSATFSPASGATIAGDASFTVQFQCQDVLEAWVLGTSVHEKSVLLRECTNPPTCSTFGPALPSTIRFTPRGAGACGTGDRAVLTPNAYLQGGSRYRVDLVTLGSTGVPSDAQSVAPLTNIQITNTPPATYLVESVAPSVVSIAPSGMGVATTTEVTVTFSEPMRPGSFNDTNFFLSDFASVMVPASVRFDATRTQAILTPNAPLAGNTSYMVNVVGGPSGVADAAGNVLAGTTTQGFTTEAVRPRVSSLFPASGATNVAVSLTPSNAVAIDFDEPMRLSTLTGSVGASLGTVRLTYVDKCSATREIYGCMSFTNNGATAFFDPSSDPLLGDPIIGDTTYSVRLDDAVISDLGGLLLDLPSSTPSVWPATFSTASSNPVVSCTLPISGATLVPVGTTVELRFNEAIDQGTVASNFTLYRKNTGAVVAGSFSFPAGDVAVFTPGMPLAPNTTYVAVAGTGITDLLANPLRSNFATEFTTAP